MEITVAYAPKISSGVDVVDEAWGGFYQGGSYLGYGRKASGRGLLPLFFTRSGIDDGQRCLYVTLDDFDALADRARSIRFELERGTDSGLLEVVQIPPLGESGDENDEILSQALASLVAQVEAKRPHRVAIDTFMPFVTFRSFGRFRTAFISMLERIDATDATLVLTMAEPANDESEQVIEFMRSQTTASLHIDFAGEDASSHTRTLSLVPGIGHGGHAAVVNWEVNELRAEPASQVPGPGRRFRFAEEPDEEEDAVSLADAQWDTTEADRTKEATTKPSGGELNGSHPPTAGGQEYLITPFKLGASGVSEVSPEEGPEPTPSSKESSKEEVTVRPIPLGRFRQREAQSEFDQPLTATVTPAEPRKRSEPSFEPRDSVDVAEETPEETEEIVESTEKAISQSDRESFRSRMQQRFLRSSINDVPFLLIAMRMDRKEEITSRPFDFEFILDLVNELLREQDDVFVDLDRERLIVMLADTEADGSRPFFAELRRRLREEAPHQADYLLQSVSAIVVPNGRPFQNAEEFLSYALGDA